MYHNVIVLNNPSQISPFIRDVIGVLQVKEVMFLDEVPNNITVGNDELMTLTFGDQISLDKRLIMFDLFLVPTLTVCKFYQNHELVYIQHGTMADLATPFRAKSVAYHRFARLIKISVRFLAVFGWNTRNLKFLNLVRKVGSWQALGTHVGLLNSFTKAIFWVQSDLYQMKKMYGSNIQQYYSCAPPDADKLKLKYKSDGKVLYISQPLVEDNIVSQERFNDWWYELSSSTNSEPHVLIHPRQEHIEYSSCSRLIDCQTLEVSKVVGHFSSLLLSVPDEIPIELHDLNDASVREYVSAMQASLRKRNINSVPPFTKLLSEVLNG